MNLFKKRKKPEISFDEILLDSSNLPSFNTNRMEGRIELPLARKNVYAVGIIFFIIACIFFSQIFKLQVIEGASFRERSEKNSFEETLIVAERGSILDRTGELLAWNEPDPNGELGFPMRAYTDRTGLGQLLGYVSYPKKDTSGFYFRTEYEGISGIESAYNEALAGTNGEQFVETTARGEVISESTVRNPIPGETLNLSIDAELSEVMHNLIATTTETNGFRSGAGAIMDIHTGEIIAFASFPSFDPEVLADGSDAEQIAAYNSDTRFPFLNKLIGGVYAPGSIVKPFVAYAALVEKIIDPNKIIVSDGALEIPNPYNPDNPSIFRDWRVQGSMTMWDAIAYSSNVYFYIVGGGFEGQKGLGITNLNKYYTLFGIGEKTGVALYGEQEGLIPNPEWKREVFDDDWRLGDTYQTAIGQFGMQVTPIQMLRAYGGIATGGTFVTPHVIKGEQGEVEMVPLDASALKVVHEGMRRTVIQDRGTARSLERSDVAFAAKSGTAELGVGNAYVNSWIAGFFPYEDPQYTFVLMMEYGPRSNTVGASSVMGKVADWIGEHRPEYFGITNAE